jgi:predicted deacylase
VSETERLLPNELPVPERLRRLGKNINGYFGETIDLPSVLRDCIAAATDRGWTVGEIPVNEKLSLPVFTRQGSIVSGDGVASRDATPRVYLSAGIHGDEPAGPLAVLQLLKENRWPSSLEVWLCPCLNPTGFALNRRENASGFDLNRQYLDPQAEQVRAHIAWLNRQPNFDLALCLHEDWESHGFYVYELNPDNQRSFAELIVRYVAEVCPIDYSPVIEDREAHNGIIRPSADPRSRPEWPEAFYLFTHKTRLSYTLEAPSDFALLTRVVALVAGVRAVLDHIQS